EAAEIGFKAHARRLHVGIRRPHNWLQLVRYCLVGASGYVVNLGVYSLLYTELSYRIAFTIAFVVAASSNFLWNRVWTFRVVHGVPHHQYARFLTVSGVALCMDLAVLTFLVDTVGLHKVTAAAIAIVVATPVSFLGNKLWSFR
ncbi:MAG: GtrA family protein, partial [Gaiellales bacterium]